VVLHQLCHLVHVLGLHRADSRNLRGVWKLVQLYQSGDRLVLPQA